jgi:hypothetical protein
LRRLAAATDVYRVTRQGDGVCDSCRAEPGGDHDKGYQFGREDLMRLRLTQTELHRLAFLRSHVADVRDGYQYGPAAGDVAKDPADGNRGA